MRRLAMALGAVTFAVICPAVPAGAQVAISSPPPMNLGTPSPEDGQITTQLGLVTVVSGLFAPPSFIATVSASPFTTGGGGPGQVIPTTSIKYWSGSATATVGLRGGGDPAQRNANQAQDLSVPRVAFRGTASTAAFSVSWNPTIIIDIPEDAANGTYTGTITHSVA